MESSLAAYLEECKDFAEWEEYVVRLMCRIGRELMRVGLETFDEALSQRRGPGVRALGRRRRTLTTRLGDVTFKRRLYVEKETGRYRFLLDETLPDLSGPVKEGLSKGVAELALFLSSPRLHRGHFVERWKYCGKSCLKPCQHQHFRSWTSMSSVESWCALAEGSKKRRRRSKRRPLAMEKCLRWERNPSRASLSRVME